MRLQCFKHIMKKLVLVIFPVLLFACQDKIDGSDVKRNPILKSHSCEGWPPQVLVRDFRYLGDIFCTYPCINCYFAVIIRPRDEKVFDDTLAAYNSFLSHYENGTVPAFFDEEEYRLLFPAVDQLTAQLFSTGEYNTTLKKLSTLDSGVSMYIFLNNGADTNSYDSTEVFRVLQIKYTED